MNPKSRMGWYVGGLCIVGVLSFVAPRIWPVEGVFNDLAKIAWVGPMLGLIIVILRDNFAHERALALQSRQHHFELGAASHMAAAVFDKHMNFCEEYLQALFDSLSSINCAGPDKRMDEVAKKLWEVRRKHLAWITEELDQKLIIVEEVLRSMAIDSRRIDAFPPGDERTKIFEKMYRDFNIFLGAAKSTNNEAALSSILERFRQLLGIQELVNIRNKIIKDVAQ